MTPIIITLSILIPSQQGRKKFGTDLGTGYGGTVCGFHTRPPISHDLLRGSRLVCQGRTQGQDRFTQWRRTAVHRCRFSQANLGSMGVRVYFPKSCHKGLKYYAFFYICHTILLCTHQQTMAKITKIVYPTHLRHCYPWCIYL